MSVDAREPVIDLGSLAEGGTAGVATARRRYPPGRDRRWPAALVAVLCVLTVTGSGRPAPPLLRTLAVLPYQQNGTFDLTPDAAYVVVGGERPTLSAYALADGARRWSAPLEWPSAGVNAVPDAGVVLVAGGDRVTVALDAATGRERWRQPGLLGALTRDTALLADYAEADGRLTRLESVRLGDGAVAWSRAIEADAGWMVVADRVAGSPPRRDDPAASRIVTVLSDGTITVLGLADGAVVVSAKVMWRAQSTRDIGFSEVNAAGDAILVGVHEPAGITVTAYDVDTLRPRWAAPGAPPGGPFACGAVLCMNDDAGIAAFDRSTGAPRWRAPGRLHAMPLASGRLLASDGAESASWAVLDDGTGTAVADLGTGAPVGDEPTLYLRPVRSAAGLTSVSRLDPATGRLRVLGAVPAVDRDGCRAAAAYLVCPAPSPVPDLRVIRAG